MKTLIKLLVVCFVLCNPWTNLNAQTTIYQTSNTISGEAQFNSQAGAAIGERLIFSNNTNARFIKKVSVILRFPQFPQQTTLIMSLYKNGCITNGVSGSACGEGAPGELILNSTITKTVSSSTGLTLVDFDYETEGDVDYINAYGFQDDEISVVLESSNSNVSWIMSSSIEIGSAPSEQQYGAISRCGDVNNGCGIQVYEDERLNNLFINIEAEADINFPTANCISSLTVEIDNDASTTVFASELDDSSYDDEGPVSLAVSWTSNGTYGESLNFNCNDIGQTFADITLRVTDQAGNNTYCTLTSMSVVDVGHPIITEVIDDFSLDLDPITGEATLDYTDIHVSSYDVCSDIDLITVAPNSFNCNDLGEQVVVLTVRDTHFNTTTQNVSITVNAPVAGLCDFPLISSSPIANATNVLITKNIEMEFEQDIDINANSLDNIIVRGSQTGVIEGVFSGGGTNTITFNPNTNFKPGETITMTIPGTLISVTGRNVIPEVFQFTVETNLTSDPIVYIEHQINNQFTGVNNIILAHLDDDNLLDVLGSKNNKISWFKNDGDQNNPQFTETAIVSNANIAEKGLAVGDINGDGHLDVIAASINGAIDWYENDGTGGFTQRSVVSALSDEPYVISVGDMDSDGYLDIVYGAENGSLVLFINDSDSGSTSTTFTQKVIQDAGTRAFRDVAIGDLDNDGNLDIVVSFENAQKLEWFQNNGEIDVDFSQNDVTADAIEITDITLGDVNDDGYLDVIAASAHENAIYWYKNSDPLNNSGFTKIEIDTNAQGAQSVSVGDVNGDGFLDVLAVSPNDNTIAWHQNDGTTGNPNFNKTEVTTEATSTTDIAVGDMNGDGYLDIVATSNSNTITWYKSTIHPDALFITTWNIVAGNTISIPTQGSGYDYDIDWDYDGVTFAPEAEYTNLTGNTPHTYNTGGTYTIAIHGKFPRIYFNNAGNRKRKIITIEQWGSIKWSSMYRAFYGCENLANLNATDIPDLSNVSNFEEMFEGCTSLEGNTSMNSWNVENADNMKDMFQNAMLFNESLNNWDVSNVRFMDRMFLGASSFNQNLGDWDIGSVVIDFFLNWGMQNMLSGTALSTANYDATLIGWATDTNGGPNNGIDDIPQDLRLDTNSVFCLAADARSTLINDNGWVIDDGGNECNESDLFITTWTVQAGDQITIPTITSNGEFYQYQVDWAYDDSGFDETSDTTIYGGDAVSPSYGNSQEIQIAIRGTFPRIYFDNTAANKNDIISIDQWGAIEWTSMEDAFFGCENLTTLNATDAPDLSNVENLSGMFSYCYNFSGNSSMNSWDVSNITTMKYLFQDAQVFNQDISNWDVSNVDDMSWMFQGATLFNQDISGWVVNSVSDMSRMFLGAEAFNQDISGWDVISVNDMSRMFQGATLFNQDISGWDVSNVTSMLMMFSGAESFNQDLSDWNVSNVSNLFKMFNGATLFNQNLGDWDISNVGTLGGGTMGDMLSNSGLSTFNYDATLIGWATLDVGETTIPQDITLDAFGLQYCSASIKRQELIDTHGWVIEEDILDPDCDPNTYFITTWDISSGETITIPTTETGYDYDIDWNYVEADGFIAGDIEQTGDITSPTYTSDGIYTIAIRGTFPRIYFNNTAVDKDKLKTIEQWGTKQWTSMEGAFYGCTNLSVINDSEAPDLSNVTSLKNMFKDAIVFNQDLNWNVENVEDMGWMFFRASNFDGDISSWNMQSVETIENMFEGATSFNQDISGWDVSNVIDMESVFKGASRFDQNIGSWNVSKVTDMHNMFQEAEDFNQDISGWNVASVERMESMFNGAISFDQDIGDWDVSNVQNMYSMFYGATLFNQNLGSWDIGNVLNEGGGFTNMLDGTALSTANYDDTLIGWATDSSEMPNDGDDDIPSGNRVLGAEGLTYCLAVAERFDLIDIDTYGWEINDAGLDPNCDVIEVSPKVYLQGASLNPNTGPDWMRDDLREAGLLQTTSPYQDGLTCDVAVFDITDSGAIVDWVWVELRDKTTNTTVIDSQSALLQRDGDVVGIDGASPLNFNQPSDDYYVAISHRNHLGVLTASTVSLSSTTTVLDLTLDPLLIDGTTNAVIQMPNGIYALYAGDYDGNGQVQNTDLNSVRPLLGQPASYENADLDMNGQVQNTDINNLLNPNTGRGEQFVGKQLFAKRKQ